MRTPANNRLWYEPPRNTGFALSLAGGTMEGPIYLHREPRYPTEAASKAYVDFSVGATGGPWLSMHGGQMRGPLLLQADPQSLSEAATRNYVDVHIRRVKMEAATQAEVDELRTVIEDLLERIEALEEKADGTGTSEIVAGTG
jgi:hypothetical protein